MTYLRARYYSGDIGRFLSRDTWNGNENQPMSYNLWNYVESNPMNYTDSTGRFRIPCITFNNRVETAERYVNRTNAGGLITDPLNTYTAAGIGVQCAGTDFVRPGQDPDYSGKGIGKITNEQAKTRYGERIPDPNHPKDKKANVGYGLLCYVVTKALKDGENIPCSICKTSQEMDKEYGPGNYEPEQVHDQTNPVWAVVYMRRRIQLVTEKCKNCTSTDIFIAAALAQNGPGFTQQNMDELSSPGNRINENDTTIDWTGYFKRPNNADDTSTQLKIFSSVIVLLQGRGWYVPDITWSKVTELSNIGN